jgi:hypothetical protein
MKYIVVESQLKTNKSREYLWNKINSPKKIIDIEGLHKNSSIKKISENNYEIKSKNELFVFNFISKKAANQIFIGNKNCPLTWFEIKGEKNCIITHGEYKRSDNGMSRDKFKKEVEWLKKHFLEELREIAK